MTEMMLLMINAIIMQEESSKDWSWFCETVCSTYEDVLAKGEHCGNQVI